MWPERTWMSFLDQWFDPGLRFERAYADHLLKRFEAIPWPGGTRVDLNREFVPVRGLDAARAGRPRLLLTGAAGAGKTTALAHLALVQARRLAAGDRAARLPVFLAARDFAPDRLPQFADLPRALKLGDTLAAQCPKDFFSQAIGSNRALVLIDDIDSLSSEAIEPWLAEFGATPVIATAQSPIPNLPVFPLPGFRDDDIQLFAEKWSRANAAGFVAALKSAGVPRSLTANPLTLTLLTRVWNMNGPLPARRTALFDAYARQVLTDGDQTAQLLESVALARLRGDPAANGLLGKSRGFLRLANHHTVEFTHDLWQHYFAARGLRREHGRNLPDALLSDTRWSETLVFYASAGDASELVETLVARGDFALAGRVVAHAQEVQADLRASVTHELIGRAWDGDSRATAALAELNSPDALEGLGARLKDGDPRVRGRAAQLLGELRLDRGLEYLLPQLRDRDGDVRDHVLAALGQARTDRVLEPLLVALRGDPRGGPVDTRLRVAAAQALAQVGSDKAVPALIVELQVGEPEVRAVAAEALKRIFSPLMFKPLATLAQTGDEETRRVAAEILNHNS
ncbi:MAG: HEAT repeat domain-containing protein [Chloroflexi bacterium]|nr:HEAT repeat domain-containing protein [Chloroflexota bacterium]